jgi:exodeoxyribonuclease VII large subunit
MEDITLSVSDFVGLLNQTLEYAYPNVTIVGELANFRVSKNRWVYFDLKDEYASVKFFGTIYQLPGPLEDGMMMQVRGNPRLHPLYGFSVTVQSMMPVGEGSLKKAAALLEYKLQKEGLFEESRKRALPYPPKSLGLITSGESAAYADFIKIMNERWAGVEINLADVQVQGDAAVPQIVRAIEYFNAHAEPPEVLVLTRGGGSAEDLGAFSTEQVTRAVAASRIPTIVAIGHEIDLSLAELAADKRASTPSNAAQMLVPDKKQEQHRLDAWREQLGQLLSGQVVQARNDLGIIAKALNDQMDAIIRRQSDALKLKKQLLQALSPTRTLDRGYAIVTRHGKSVTSIKQLKIGSLVKLRLRDGSASAEITEDKVQ